MYTLNYEGIVVRKATRSAMNDCVYLTSPDAPTGLVVDSKRHAALRLSDGARAHLVKTASRLTA